MTRPITTHTILAQVPPTKADPVAVITTVGILIAAVVALSIIILAIRRRMLTRDADTMADAGAMEQLRQLRATGQISAEEFSIAKAKLAGRMLGPALKPKRKPRNTPNPTATNVALAASAADGSVLIAQPGRDLTGAPLPQRTHHASDHGHNDPRAHPPHDHHHNDSAPDAASDAGSSGGDSGGGGGGD